MSISEAIEIEINQFWKRANIRMVDSFSKGRIFVVGGQILEDNSFTFAENPLILYIDAAHVHSPAGGQVCNTTIMYPSFH